MSMITVNRETCTQCGLCARVCPDHIIYHKEQHYPRQVPGTDQLCIRCGHCVAVCPSASLSHQEVPLEQCPPVRPELNISPEQCAQFIRARRSIREFKDTAIPRPLIEKLIDTAHYAPTGHNNQDVEWLVVDNRETLLQIEKAGTGWMREMILQQPQMAEMMNFKTRLLEQEKELTTFLRGAPALIGAISAQNNAMAAIDCTIAMTTFELAATSLGLGGCWGGFVYFMAGSYPPVQSILKIPEGKSGYAFLMLGYPRYRYARMPARKPAPVIWRE